VEWSWSVDGNDLQSLQAVRSRALALLREHGDYCSDFDACALALSELLGNAVRHGPGGLVTVGIDWRRALPRLSVRDLGHGFPLRISLPPGRSEGGRGLFLISRLVGTPTVSGGPAGCTVSVVLPVRRRIEIFGLRTSA
jgi:anti-sigma regulatory factor (Ser/Thr protein kinase)